MFIKVKSFGKDKLINTDHIIKAYDGPRCYYTGPDSDPSSKLVVVMRDGKVTDVDITLGEFVKRYGLLDDVADLTI